MTDSPRRDGARARRNRSATATRIHRSGVREPGALRPHLPGPAGRRSHRAAARVLAVRLRPVRDRPANTAAQYPPGGSRRAAAGGAEVAALAVDRRRDRGAGRHRPGHRAGHRQQLPAGDRRRAAAVAARAELHHTDDSDDDVTHSHASPSSRCRRCRRAPPHHRLDHARAPPRPWSTTSPATAGPSTSPTSTPAACCRPSSM